MESNESGWRTPFSWYQEYNQLCGDQGRSIQEVVEQEETKGTEEEDAELRFLRCLL